MVKKTNNNVSWSQLSPTTGYERERLFKECGSSCFLKPNFENPSRSGFPICSKCNNDLCSCTPTCKGLNAAYVRSRQWKHEGVAKVARDLQGKYNCINKDKNKSVTFKKPNAFIEFLKSHKDQGYSKSELLNMYNRSKNSL